MIAEESILGNCLVGFRSHSVHTVTRLPLASCLKSAHLEFKIVSNYYFGLCSLVYSTVQCIYLLTYLTMAQFSDNLVVSSHVESIL